jgi:hypothetical protein
MGNPAEPPRRDPKLKLRAGNGRQLCPGGALPSGRVLEWVGAAQAH